MRSEPHAEHSEFLVESSRYKRCCAEARRRMRISVRVWFVSCHCSWDKILLSNTTLPSLLFSILSVFLYHRFASNCKHCIPSLFNFYNKLEICTSAKFEIPTCEYFISMVTVAVVLIFKQDGGEFARKKC